MKVEWALGEYMDVQGDRNQITEQMEIVIDSHPTIESYGIGYGAGCGEEYSNIPEYEDANGYYRLLDDLELGNYLPNDYFVHPKTGDLWLCTDSIGSCEGDRSDRYVRVV